MIIDLDVDTRDCMSLPVDPRFFLGLSVLGGFISKLELIGESYYYAWVSQVQLPAYLLQCLSSWNWFEENINGKIRWVYAMPIK